MKNFTAALLLLTAAPTYAVEAPMVCPAGQTGTTVFFDGFEVSNRNFVPVAIIGRNVWRGSGGNSNTGIRHLRAAPRMEVALSAKLLNVPGIPIQDVGYYLQFSHTFGFEAGGATGPFLDGGTVVYSIDGFNITEDAGPLIVGGQRYNGVIHPGSDNPLAGYPAFVGSNSGYQVTRLDLSSLVGQNFSFGFWFGSNSSGRSFGWQIDDVHVYRCEGPPSTTPPAPRTCQGVTATLVGTDENDILNGTSVRDVIVGFRGNDRIRGSWGNDLICAGPGNDIVRGGAGKDKIYGDAGRDRLSGNGGKDKLIGGPGRDRCIGGPGKDSARCEVKRSIP